MKKVFLVTGANRGIGKAVTQALALMSQEEHIVYLTSRDPKLGEAAAKDLKEKYGLISVHFEQCDVSNEDSVRSLASRLTAKNVTLAALINNAGAGWDITGKSLTPDLADEILETNYFGPARMVKFLRPLILKPGGRIINVGSEAGVLKQGRYSQRVIDRLTDPNASLDDIDEMARSFLQNVRDYHQLESSTVTKQLEWPIDAYRSSKALLNAYSHSLAKQYQHEGVFVASVCPGWVRSRMGGSAAPRSLEEGADTIVWLATSSEPMEHSGKFWQDRRQIKTVW